MKFFALIFFILLNIPVVSSETLNGTYIICERTEDYMTKEKDKLDENYIFLFMKHSNYEQKKIFKKDKNSSINFSFELFNTGQYEFKENSLFFNDSLKFREKSYKRHLDRNTMILKSKYKEKVVFEHFCEVTDLIKFRIKYIEIINNLKKFWKNKYKDNKI